MISILKKLLINCDISFFLSFIAFAIFFSSTFLFISALAYFKATSLFCWDFFPIVLEFFGTIFWDFCVIVEKLECIWLNCTFWLRLQKNAGVLLIDELVIGYISKNPTSLQLSSKQIDIGSNTNIKLILLG